MDWAALIEAARLIAPLGVTGLNGLYTLSILKGWLTPPGVIRREDHIRQMNDVKAAADARVVDAQAALVAAKEEARVWRDAWRESESGRRVAAEQTLSVLTGVSPLTQALTSLTATRGVQISDP